MEALEEEFGVTVRAASQALLCGAARRQRLNYHNREKYREFLVDGIIIPRPV
jgi:hypothetical protein